MMDSRKVVRTLSTNWLLEVEVCFYMINKQLFQMPSLKDTKISPQAFSLKREHCRPQGISSWVSYLCCIFGLELQFAKMDRRKKFNPLWTKEKSWVAKHAWQSTAPKHLNCCHSNTPRCQVWDKTCRIFVGESNYPSHLTKVNGWTVQFSWKVMVLMVGGCFLLLALTWIWWVKQLKHDFFWNPDWCRPL